MKRWLGVSLNPRVPIRARRERMPLVMDQRLEDLVNHREVVVVVLELTLEIDQVGRQTMQPLSKKLRELVSNLLMRLKECIASVDHMGPARRRRTYCRHGRNIE